MLCKMGKMCNTQSMAGRTDERTNANTEANANTFAPVNRRMLAVFVLVGIALSIVITAPVLLSSQDLYRWANDPHGLGLPPEWAWLVPVALDCAATAMVGMTVVCTWRRERPGLFEVLVWVFAGVSAYAQYQHGTDLRAVGGPQDAWWAFPGFALLGPVLLHVTLARLRRWARQDAGEQARGAAGFGSMWLPFVAFRQTAKAWAASRREQIANVDDAVAYVREVKALKDLTPEDAIRYALAALRTDDTHAARVWLQARYVTVGQDAIDAVRRTLPVANTRCERTPNADIEPSAPKPRTRTAQPSNVRPLHRPAPATAGKPATDEQIRAVERRYPEWRTNMPSARDLSALLGASSTTPGSNLQKALRARLNGHASAASREPSDDPERPQPRPQPQPLTA